MNNSFDTALNTETKAYVPPARNTDGVLRAYTRVNVTNIFGQHVSKRVSLGTDWNTTLETARDLVKKARESNSVEIQAEYRINL